MRFSSRLPARLDANRVSEAVARLKRDGVPFLDLTLSNPTRAQLPYPAGLLEPLADARGLEYRPEPLGLLEARRAVCADFARRGQTLAPESVALTASTSEAYSLLFKLLCDPGDEVLIPQPSYPLFEHLTRLDGVRAVPYQLEYHGRWAIDIDSLDRALSPRTRIVLVVSPNNPTGHHLSAADLDALADRCAARQAAIVSDEVFADYALDADEAPRGALLGRTDVAGFTLGGLSKSIGLPQAKLGWIAVSGPASFVGETMPRLELVCDTYLSVSTPVQLATPALLEHGAAVREAIQSRLRENLAACDAMLAAAPSCTRLHAAGGWYAVLRVPSLQPEDELMLSLLEHDRVLVQPGYFFDFAHESFLVVSLLPEPAAFREGLSRVLARFSHVGRA